MPTRVGSSAIVNTSANSGSSSITVPTCNLALLQWYGLGGGTNLMTSMSLDGVTGTEIGQSPGTAASAGSFGCGGFYVKSPAAGSKTFAWDFNGTGGFTEGGILAISFFDSVDVSGEPVRDWGVDCADETDNLTDTLTTASDDFVHIGAISFGSSCNTGITGQTTDQEPAAYDNGYVDLAHVNSPGSSTTPVAANGAFYGAAFFVALKNSVGGGVTGTGAGIAANDRASGTGTTSIAGTGADRNKGDAASGSGTTTILASAADLPGSDRATGTGSTTVLASGAGIERGDRAAGTGSVGSSVDGTGATIAGNDKASGTGTTTILGGGADLSASDKASGTGTTTIVSAGAATSGNDKAAGTGTTSVSGSGAAIAGNDSAFGLGASGNPVGTGAAIGGNDSGLGFGSVPIVQAIQSGGAVIVDLPKKKRKKSLKKEVDEPVEAIPQVIPQDLTEEQVKGMEAIYGAQMRPAVEAMPAEAPPEVVEQLADAIIEPFEVPPSVFADPEPVAVEPQKPVETEEPTGIEDDIALIMAIIEAIG